jgi:phosphatidylinositol alpha-1,6-mannosyltransferase
LDAHYVIIGLGEDRTYLSDLAQNLNVTQRVHLLGHVDSSELPRWFNAADVFAMPNRVIHGDNEGFGMVFLEAAACGKPVVAGVDGGTGAAVIDHVTGLRVAGDDLSAVSDALERLLRDSSLAQAMGEAGLSRVRERFSWGTVAEATMQLHFP